jgi:glyoxalase family protein
MTYLVASDGLDFWTNRLDERVMAYEPRERFDDSLLRFEDPDDVTVEIIASADARHMPANPWEGSPVPAEHQIRGFHSVTLAVAERGPTETVLERLGYEGVDQEGDRYRYRTPANGTSEANGANEVGHSEQGGRRRRSPRNRPTPWPDGGRDGSSRRVRRRGRRRGACVARDTVGARPPGDRRRGQGLFSSRSTSGSRAGCSSRSQRRTLGSPRTNRSGSWETRLTLPEWFEADRERIESRLPDVDFERAVETA